MDIPGAFAVIDRLIEAGACTNGGLALHYAAALRQSDLVTGADINLLDPDGNAPLMIAASVVDGGRIRRSVCGCPHCCWCRLVNHESKWAHCTWAVPLTWVDRGVDKVGHVQT